MKKTYSDRRKSLFFLVLFAVCLSFFNAGCGLDVIDSVLEDPFYTDNVPNIESGYENCNFRFSTVKLDNANAFGKGYIYYKIYNNSNRKNTEVNNIESMTSDSSRKYNAATTLINTYSYKELHYVSSLGGSAATLSLDNDSQNIYIRLTNYADPFIAQITVDNGAVGIPVRYNGKSFDFGRPGDYYEKPVKSSNTNNTEENASDYKSLDSTGDENGNAYYVVLYGVFYMPTESFEKIIYSPVHYLGEVKIDAGTEYN